MTSSHLASEQLFVKFVNNSGKYVFILSNELLKHPESRFSKLAEETIKQYKTYGDYINEIEIYVSINEYTLKAIKYFYKNDSWDYPPGNKKKLQVRTKNKVLTNFEEIRTYLELPVHFEKPNNSKFEDDDLMFKFDLTDMNTACECF